MSRARRPARSSWSSTTTRTRAPCSPTLPRAATATRRAPPPAARSASRSSRREPVTLLLLDVVMPGLDGFAVCRALRATAGRPRGPRSSCSPATTSLAVRRQGMRHGVCEFLTKPVDPEALLARVRAQLRVVALTRRLDGVERLLDGRIAPLTGR